MAMQQQKSALLAKYGANLDKAVQQHAADETDWGFQKLPPGIRDGIAQLKKCYFEQYKSGEYKGEYYFRAEGSVIEPDTHTWTDQGSNRQVTTQTKGLMTSIMIAVCDTQTKGTPPVFTSQEEHVADILNMMRRLGADTSGATGADLESLAAALQQAKPYFKFSTSARKDQKTGKLTNDAWENWSGIQGLETYQGPGAADGVQDGSGGPSPQPSVNGAGNGGLHTATAAPEFNEFEDLNSLAIKASPPTNDADAQRALLDAAAKAGISQEVIVGAESWQAVVAMIQADSGATTDANNAQGTASDPTVVSRNIVPEEKKVYNYRPFDKKQGKKVDKAVECVVTTVDKAGQTVNLKSLTNGKVTFMKVPFAELELPG